MLELMLIASGNAKIVGLQKDLDMTGVYDYNQLASLFYVSYIIFEVPSNLACKWIGPGWFLPLLTLGFGAMSLVFAYVQNLQQACAVRFLLGMFESGVMPGMSYYLSRWYDHSFPEGCTNRQSHDDAGTADQNSPSGSQCLS